MDDEPVHATMPCTRGGVGILLPQRVLVLVLVLLELFPLVRRAAAFDVDRMVHIHPQALGALHAEAHRVRARQRSVVLQRSEEHTSELQSQSNLVCPLLLEKKKKTPHTTAIDNRS